MAEIKFSDITTKELDGTGVFDELMQTVNTHLLEEYSKNRIRGTDYSNLYLGSMQATLQQSLSFLLGRQQADKQAELIDSQRDLVILEIIGAKKNNDLKDKQIEKMDAEIRMIEQQILTQIQQVINMEKQNIKTDAEIALMNQQLTNLINTNNNISKQGAKLDTENQLLNQKWETEKAQTEDITGGLIGRQQELFAKQVDGFNRDAEQKLTKIMVDAHSLRMSKGNFTDAGVAGVSDLAIKDVVDKARAGLDIGTAPIPV